MSDNEHPEQGAARVHIQRIFDPSDEDSRALVHHVDDAPWVLQQFFDGDIDLDAELARRFPNMPMLTIIRFRTLGANQERQVASLETQDGSASLVLDADAGSKAVLLSFTFGSMMTLRFALDELSPMDRSRWLELMRREQGGLAFLWGASRWADDYLISTSRKYHTNLYAFSPNNFEAAVRLSPTVMEKMLDWLETIWTTDPDTPDSDAPLLTW